MTTPSLTAPVNVICMKWGRLYGPEYVNHLHAGVGSSSFRVEPVRAQATIVEAVGGNGLTLEFISLHRTGAD